MDKPHGVVLETLQRATSQNTEFLKPAELQLKQWEIESGFYSILKDIFTNRSIEYNVRLLAVLYCKNGVERYWRKTAPNAMKEEEKANIRNSLIADFTEPVNQLTVQIAVLIAKIARYDCPYDWGELIPTLMNAIRSEDHNVQHRGILCLHHVVKALSSKCLGGDRRMFRELCSSVFSFVYQCWDSNTLMFFMKIQEGSEEAVKYLQKSLLSLKVLDKFIVHGFKKPHESQDATTFLKTIFDRAKTMLEIRSLKESLQEVVDKCIVRLVNVLLNLLQQHPFSFVDFIRPSLEFAVFYAFTPAGEQFLFNRFLIQCFNLIKAIHVCSEYRLHNVVRRFAKGITDPDLEASGITEKKVKVKSIKQSFFYDATLSAICRKLITHYFLLTPNDLQLWEEDPETFAIDEEGESWKYALRPSTESLFTTLFHEYRATMAPILVELLQTNHALVSPYDFPSILAKDAVYNAIGLAAFDMYDEVNFDEWFSTTLRAELNVTVGSYRILRRRIAWLLGRWTGVKLSADLHPLLYSSMIPLLEPSEDIVVRLTAASTIRTVVDNFEFSTESFLEFLEPLFRLLFTLLQEAQECDTKMRVLNVLNFIVEQVGVSIEPYCHHLIRYLPLLWHESESHSMLRCAVVTTLVHLVKALGTLKVSDEGANFVLSVIALSTDMKQKSSVYLLEDGLELWHAVLEVHTQPTPELLQLFVNMPPIMEENSEHFRMCVSIIHAYILLAPEEFLQAYGEAVVSKCAEMMTDMKAEGILMIMKLFELCIKANPTHSVNLLKPLLPNIFEVVYNGKELPLIMSSYLSILARVLLLSKETFIEVTRKLSEAVGQPPDVLMNKLLDVWLENMPLVTRMDRRKLLGLALSSLLTAQSRFVYDKFCGILLAVVEILNDITRTDDMGVRTDSLIFTGQDLDSSPSSEDTSGPSFETEHERRRKHLNTTDPVHSIVLEDYFRNQLDELQRSIGQAQFDQFVQTVDVETLAMVREYVQV